MKKAISIILSLTLLFSTITCMFQNVSAEPTGQPAVLQQTFEGITYLNANNGTQRNPDNVTTGKGNANSHGSIESDTDGNHYLKIEDSGKWVRYVNNITETGGLLEVGATYSVSFVYRLKAGSCASPTGKKVKICFYNHDATSYPQNATNTVELSYDATKVNEWRTATIDNVAIISETLSSGYAQIQIPGNTAIEINLDDITFSKVALASATADGSMGAALVDKVAVKNGETVTYTAKEYKSGAFAGWFNGEELVSSEKVYTITYTGSQELNLIAKFNGIGIVQDFEKGWPAGKNPAVNPDSIESKTCWGTVKTDDSTYMSVIIGSGQTIHYITSKAQTGLLKTGKSYNLTFKYRFHKGTSGQTGSAVVFAVQKYSQSGNSGYKQVSKNYVDGTEWQTATIENIVPVADTVTIGGNSTDVSGYIKLRITGGCSDLVVDVDDFVFEEYNKVSAQSVGAGSGYASAASVQTGEKVTFTATAPKGVEFYGWYDGDNKVSDDLVYSFTFDGTQKLELTAKFSGGILQNFEKISTVNTPNFKYDPDGKKEYSMWGSEILKEESGNKYINVQGFYDTSALSEAGKSVHYLTNAAETGLLEDSSYKVTFKYRVRKGTSETFTEATKGERYPNGLTNGNVKVTFLPQDYAGAIDSATTNAMISNPNNSVTLAYDAENEEEWKTITLFNMPRYKVDGAYADEGMLKLRITSVSGYTLDLDDFYFSPITISGDYDELENWKIYDFISEQTEYGTAVRGNIIGEGAVEAASPSKYWASITYNLDNAYLYDNADEYSIKVKAQTQYTATTLDVDKNTDYVLSFKYYAPEKAVISGELKNNLSNAQAAIGSIGIVKPNGRYNFNSDDLISYVARDSAFTGPYSNRITNYLTTTNSNVESWESLELPFNSGDLDKVAFVIQSGANTIYLEDIKLEKRKMDIPGPGEPKDKVVIDFDNNGEIELQASDRMEITTAKNYEDKNSKMLHIFRNDYDKPTLFNADTAYNADKDNTFTFAVKGNTVYKVTFRAKVFKDDTFKAKDLNGDGTNENPWFQVLAHYSGWQPATRQMAYMLWGRNNTWEEYTYYLTTDEKQDVFSFTFNAGQITPETWIDDIVVEETDFAVFKGHSEAKQKITINFDDYAVNSEYSDRLRIDAAPEKDGNKNNIAMKFIAGRYEGAACLNPTATRKGTDPVFSIPANPNTLYKLSYWMYVTPDQQLGVKWFKFYYFQNPETWESEGLLDATAMPQRGEWVKFETSFVTAADQTKVNLALSSNNNLPEMWLDDITLEEVMPGGLQIMDNESYCSDFYNILIDEGVASKIESGKSGVYKIPVNDMTQYTFGVTVKSKKASSSRIFLSFDGVNPMEPSEKENPVSMVISSDGKSARHGLMFVSSRDGYVYIVVENDDGALKLEEPALFRSFSLSTAQPMGYEKAPLESLSYPTELIKLELLGEDDELIDDNYSDSAEDNSEDYNDSFVEPEENTDSFEEPTESPETSDDIVPSMLFVIFGLSALAVIATLKSKKEAK